MLHPLLGKLLEIIHSAVQASQIRNSLSASLVTNNNLASFNGLPRWGSAGDSQDHGTKRLYSIVVCGMHIVVGIRSSLHRPRHHITLMLARQLWQPVSVMAQIVNVLACILVPFSLLGGL